MLPGQEDHGIAGGMAAAQKQQVDLAAAAMKHQPVLVGHIGRGGPDLGLVVLEFLLGLLGIGQLLAQDGLLRGIGFHRNLLLEAGDQGWARGGGRQAEGLVVQDIEG